MSEKIQVLPNGFPFDIGHPYSPPEARAATFTVVVASFELVATVGLLAAILLSAFNTRTSNDPNLFVRTHSAIFFISLLLCTVLQAIGGIMTSTWVKGLGVYMGPVCTAQAVIKHISDIGLALWSLTIAVYSFCILWRSRSFTSAEHPPHKLLGFTVSHEVFFKWVTVATVWFTVGIIVVLGPEITTNKLNGDFYGVSGEWCWITDGYIPERIVFGYLIMIVSAVISLALYTWVFYHNRKKLRVEKPASEYIISDEDQADEYAIKLSRYMIWYPLTYFCCILPLVILRFVYWAGVPIPFGATVFTDVIYHLLGIVNTILFLCTPRLLPALTLFSPIFTSSAYVDSRTKTYAKPQHREEKRFMPDRRPPPLTISGPTAPRPVHVAPADDGPFSTPRRAAPSPPQTSEARGTMRDRINAKRERRAAPMPGLPARSSVQRPAQDPPSEKSSPSRASIRSARTASTISTASTASSVNKDLPLLPRPQQRGPGLPARPSSRTSLRDEQPEDSPFADPRPRSRAPSYALRRQAAGLPMHPAAPRRPAREPVAAGPDVEHSQWSATTATVSTAAMSTATASLGLPTAYFRGAETAVTAAPGRRSALPRTAMSSASPLTGAHFEMVTRPGIYVTGRDDGISEEGEEEEEKEKEEEIAE